MTRYTRLALTVSLLGGLAAPAFAQMAPAAPAPSAPVASAPVTGPATDTPEAAMPAPASKTVTTPASGVSKKSHIVKHHRVAARHVRATTPVKTDATVPPVVPQG